MTGCVVGVVLVDVSGCGGGGDIVGGAFLFRDGIWTRVMYWSGFARGK